MSDLTQPLTAEEYKDLHNAEFFIRKAHITEQIRLQLQRLRDQLRPSLTGFPLPEGVDTRQGKISRGEQYRGLPYLMLDFPRLFRANDVFACRTMFWWGNFFSLSLHLEGHSLRYYQPELLGMVPALRDSDVLIGVGPTPWEHHLAPDNCQPAHQFGNGELAHHFRTHPFCKLVRTYPLRDYATFADDATRQVRQWLEALHRNNL